MIDESSELKDLSVEIAAIDERLYGLYSDLGRKYFESLEDGDFPEGDAGKLAELIVDLVKRKSRMEATAEEIRERRLERERERTTFACPSCGAAVLGADLFCMSCGSKFERHCAECGAPLVQGDAFCIACGAKAEPFEEGTDGSVSQLSAEDPSKGRFCTSCGQLLKEGDVFCKSCGVRIS